MAAKKAAKPSQKKKNIIRAERVTPEGVTGAAGGEGEAKSKRFSQRRRFSVVNSDGERTKLMTVVLDEQKGGFRVHTLAENLSTGNKVKTVRGYDLSREEAVELFDAVCEEQTSNGWESKRIPVSDSSPSPDEV